MSQMLHIEIPNFGNTVLGCLNEQRLLGLYCDVSIVVKGQAFKAHRAVLAASSLYFRDLFSGNSKNAFELPGTVPPACFQQILSFCYTGKLTMAASEQLVVMYTAGFLQIQHIVEKGTDLMFKVSSPHCDSQTAMIEDPSSEPQSPCNQLQSASAPYVMSPSMPIPLLTRVKHENLELQAAAVPGLATKRPLEPAARDGAGGGGPAAGPLKLSRVSYYGVPNLATLLPNVQQVQYSQGERTSPGASSIPTTDSPTSYHNEEDEEDDEAYDTMVEEQYGQMYIKSSGGYSEHAASNMGLSSVLSAWSIILQRNGIIALYAVFAFLCHGASLYSSRTKPILQDARRLWQDKAAGWSRRQLLPRRAMVPDSRCRATSVLPAGELQRRAAFLGVAGSASAVQPSRGSWSSRGRKVFLPGSCREKPGTARMRQELARETLSEAGIQEATSTSRPWQRVVEGGAGESLAQRRGSCSSGGMHRKKHRACRRGCR
ncbi:nucleus accumbens-associated protein 2 isoform X2 [Anser cygnoides]|uniref:nucleus accumbens-associated protein 2 isoform X2 n=1 Tax=Anser cygnoides TaxID=8845 RepID=UPI0034D30EE6